MEDKQKNSFFDWIRSKWNWFRQNWWYLFLLVLSTLYIYHNRIEILSLSSINAQAVIALLWVILLILPLFSELEFFGIRLKKELEKVRKDVKNSVDEVKNQIIQLRFNNSSNIDINITQSPLPDKQETERLTTEVEQLQANIVSTDKKTDENDISSETLFLFKARLRLEKILLDICERTDYKGLRNIPNMLQYIVSSQMISYEIYNLAIQLIKIANRGIHGEIVDDEYLNFAEKTYPVIMHQLQEVHASLHYIICRKCHFSGYTKQEGYCPNCGTYNAD